MLKNEVFQVEIVAHFNCNLKFCKFKKTQTILKVE